jgi:hypothetical protein
MAEWPLSYPTYNPLPPSPPKLSLINSSTQNLWKQASEYLELYIRSHIILQTIQHYLSISFQ